MDATRIVAIRHGETAWNAESRLQGHQDIALNPQGQRQADTLAQALRDEGLVAVYSSDLARAWQTAQALAEPLALALQADVGLRERCFGEFEGLTYAQIDARWPEQARRWRQRELDFVPVGAESLGHFHARCVTTLDRLAAAHVGQAIAVICHGGVLDSFYRAANRLALKLPRQWTLGNATINRLLHTPQGLRVVGWNDAGHLDTPACDETST